MKYVSVLAVVICSFATACSIKSETVVQKPTPAVAPTAVVYSDAAPSSGTVYVPVRQ
jgi:hypothetical protein